MARDTAGRPPRFPVRPLPGATPDAATLKRWFRQFVEVRDADGAERCIVSALRAGMAPATVADMLFAAVTDHRYIDIGHPLDFTNKALEALDATDWENAELVLTSLVRGYAMADRMEESNAWRHPIDLVAILETAFERLPALWERPGGSRPSPLAASINSPLLDALLGDDPQAIVDALLAALEDGQPAEALAQAVAYAAALRIARFHTSNEFGDWDTALHTFTFANAVHQGLRRAPSPELLRGVFDAAMSIYLDRFLNTPAARLPEPQPGSDARCTLGRPRAHCSTASSRSTPPRSWSSTTWRPAPIRGGCWRRSAGCSCARIVISTRSRPWRRRSASTAWRPMTRSARISWWRLPATLPRTRRPCASQGQTYQIALRLHRGEALFEG